jgi:N-alpha-acetyltransferase 50
MANAEASLSAVTVQNVGSLKVLNAKLFPVAYKEPFYKDILANHLETSRMVFYSDVLVGNVCCRVEAIPDVSFCIFFLGGSGCHSCLTPLRRQDADASRVYIMTLGVLRPYRRLGIGQTALEYVLNDVCKSSSNIKAVRLHVQSSNEEAIAFYKKAGFESVETIPGYYPRLEGKEAQAEIFEKTL